MTAPSERTVDTLGAFVDAIDQISSASELGFTWFRGSREAAWNLIPRLYRGGESAEVLVKKEQHMLGLFRARSKPYLDLGPSTPWQHFFVMQHYGVPTRLLDWSENAFLALFFAVEDATEHGPNADAVVWVLDPVAWNLKTLPGAMAPEQALFEENPGLENYAPDRDLSLMGERIVAMYAMFNNPRITAQRGVFTVFGLQKKPLDTLYGELDFAAGETLNKLVIPSASAFALKQQLRRLGFTTSMIYPDLDGLATELRESAGLG